jgi:hypothetical protein
MNGGFTFHSVVPAHSTPHTDPNEDYTMHRNLTAILLAATLALTFSATASAGPREDQMAQYASAAKAANPAFAGFSAERGKTLHNQAFTGGKPDTPACTSCHGKDPRAATPIRQKSRSGSSATAAKCSGANAMCRKRATG